MQPPLPPDSTPADSAEDAPAIIVLTGALRGAGDTSFSVQVGDVAILPAVRYCLTLDSDTRLPRDAAKKLIGISAASIRFSVIASTITRPSDTCL